MTEEKLDGYLSPLLRKLRFKQVFKYFEKKEGSILDIGCDNAELLKYIPKKYIKSYLGIDFNPKVIEENSKKYEKEDSIQFQLGDANSLQKLDKKFDSIFLIALIEHISEFETLLEKIYDISNDKAKIYITTPVAFADNILHIGSKVKLFAKESLDEHERYFSKKDFTNIKSWNLYKYKKFEFGLNQLIILEKND